MVTKQIIVMRADLEMSPGKMCAQAAHASMSFLTRNLIEEPAPKDTVTLEALWFDAWSIQPVSRNFAAEMQHWLEHDFTKITLFVDSEEELNEIFELASNEDLEVHMITDNGKTEFNGQPTKTCLAIGPHDINAFVGITDKLRTSP